MTRHVHKLGGATVADAESIRRTLAQVDPEDPALLVVSAPAGVTDALLAVAQTRSPELLDNVLQRFRTMAKALLGAWDVDALAAELCPPLEQAEADQVLALGERLNARLIAAWLSAAGRSAVALDATELLVADGSGQVIDAGALRPRVASLSHRQVAVLTGYVAQDQAGSVVTLGRNGSDYSAAVAAAAIGALDLTFWTDTDGVRSADPALLGSRGQLIGELSHEQASVLARLGTGLLHPRTLQPLAGTGIPVRILDPRHPTLPGTRIGSRQHWPEGGIGLILQQRPDGDALLIPAPDSAQARALEREASTCLDAAVAMDRDEPSVARLALKTGAGASALRLLHQRLYDGPRPIQLVLLGTGNVGMALEHELGRVDAAWRLRHGLRAHVRVVANSRTMTVLPAPGRWAEAHRSPTDLDRIARIDNDCTIVIDATASPAVAARHADWLARGLGVVTANKRSASDDLGVARVLLASPAFGLAATVGAGLPFVEIVRRLQDSGDPPRRLEAVLSGSVNAVLGHMHRGQSFAGALSAAQAAGLVEPNPAEDLNGTDTARKLVILARLAGEACELADVQVTPLVRDPGREGAGLDRWVAALRRQGRRLVYGARWVPGRLEVGPLEVEADSPLHSEGPQNVIVLHNSAWQGLPLRIAGPGAGPGVTAAALARDVLSVAQHLVAVAARDPAHAGAVGTS